MNGYFGLSHSWHRPTANPLHSGTEIPPAPAGKDKAHKLWKWTGEKWNAVAGWDFSSGDDYPFYAEIVVPAPPIVYMASYRLATAGGESHWIFDEDETNE